MSENENTALAAEFEEVVSEAAKLPEKEQEKIALFISGYIAATKTKGAAAAV